MREYAAQFGDVNPTGGSHVSDIAISFSVLGGVVVLFVWNKLPVEIVAIAATLTLWATGVLTVNEAFAGFGDTTVVFIASLFVVSEALDHTGVTAWAGQQVVRRASDRNRMLTLVMLLCALLTALISVNGAVAALLPMVVVLAVRIRQPTSQFLMPLAFAAHAGSLLALTGTPVNVLVSEAAADAGLERFGFFEFTIAGVPLLIGTVVIVLVFGKRLLPERSGKVIPADLSEQAKVLHQHYLLDSDLAETLITREAGVAEVIVTPRSSMIGETVFPGMSTESGDLVVLAVQRKGEDRGPGETVLASGDTLLVQGEWADLEEQIAADPGVLPVDQPNLIRRQAVPLGVGAKRAIAVLAVMIVLLATGAVPAAVAGLLAACAMVLLGVLSIADVYRSISWTTVILVGAMIPLSNAIQQTGAADRIAHGLIRVVGDAGPYALILGVFVLTATLGQLISNMATALIVAPVAVSAATELDVSGRPVLMVVTIAAAASFITPVATPVNMMVMGPGGYRFGDYWKMGLPLMAWYLVVAMGLVPLVWQF